MKKSYFLMGVLSLFVFITLSMKGAYSSVFEVVPSSKVLHELKLDDEVTMTLPNGTKVKTKIILSGVRKKQIAIVWPKVYVAQIGVKDAGSFTAKNTGDTLTFLKNQKEATLSLSFLRDLGPEKIKNGFIDGLKENGEDPTTPGLKEILETIEGFGAFKEHGVLRVGFMTTAAEEDTIFEYGDKMKNLKLPLGTMKKLWGIWFGKPADSGIKDFQESVFEKEKEKK